MAPLGSLVVDVDDAEGAPFRVGQVEDHGGQASEAMVGTKFDVV